MINPNTSPFPQKTHKIVTPNQNNFKAKQIFTLAIKIDSKRHNLFNRTHNNSIEIYLKRLKAGNCSGNSVSDFDFDKAPTVNKRSVTRQTIPLLAVTKQYKLTAMLGFKINQA